MKILMVIDQPPYSSAKCQESLDMALALATFDAEVSILFKGAGITNLLVDQLPKNQGLKDFTRIINGLDLYDIQKIYVDEAACQTMNIAPLDLFFDAQAVNQELMKELISTHQRVLKL